MLDGRYSNEQLLAHVNNDDTCAVKNRICKVECLLIDEIGMISKKILEQLEYICRMVRDPATVFGGIQVIGSGDFKQLPPVKNDMYLDSGEYCFTSHLFYKMFPHHIQLQQVGL